MRVAILFTGLDEVFPKINKRVFDLFNCEGIEFDFFGHTWEEKITMLNANNETWDDISEKFVKKNVPFPYKDDRIKNHKTSSYQEIYDKYISRDDLSNVTIQNKMIFFMSYMSQNMSTYYAFKALEEYKKENNVHYDLVIKWRWDLLFDTNEQYKLDGLKNHRKNTMYSPYVDNNQMSDFWWGCDYETFEVLMDSLPDKMSQCINNAVSFVSHNKSKNKYFLYHERMILESFVLISNENNLSLKFNNLRFPGVTVFRPELNGDEDYWSILDYNKTKWINQGWETRNVKN